MNTSSETLLTLWHDNAAPWAQAVRDKTIESRRLATDQAVIDAVLATGARRVLDVGCGEGWLTRALTQQGLEVLGLDAVPPLIEQARQAGGGQFAVAAFDALMDSALAVGFDTWVCNFSLFHPDDGPTLVAAAARRLPPQGALVIQTLHGNATTQGPHSGDAWQPGGWGACGSSFGEAIPWYFRCQQSWNALLADQGLSTISWREPQHPDSGQALSMLLTARR